MPASPWPAIAAELSTIYVKEYFSGMSFGEDNFIRCLVPSETWNHPTQGVIDCTKNFFGTKVLNIFIAQKPYGWVGEDFVWDNPSSEYSQMIQAGATRLSTINERFPYYKTIIYGDLYTISSSGCPDVIDKMRRTIARLGSFCSTTAGFEYGGTIESQVPASFFQDAIDNFYGKPLYKIDSVPL